MPKLTDATRAARRATILRAARRCFAEKGFSATTIADLCTASGLSAGGIYVHFENKHAIAEAIGRDATTTDTDEIDPHGLLEHLVGADGAMDARLDLQLWAESLHDPALSTMVTESMDGFRSGLADSTGPDHAGVLEALALGVEVQRALGRPIDVDGLRRLIDDLSPAGGPP